MRKAKDEYDDSISMMMWMVVEFFGLIKDEVCPLNSFVDRRMPISSPIQLQVLRGECYVCAHLSRTCVGVYGVGAYGIYSRVREDSSAWMEGEGMPFINNAVMVAIADDRHRRAVCFVVRVRL